MMNYIFFFRNTLVALIGCVMLFAACNDEKEEPKSSDCDILSFTVNGVAWAINGTDITHTFPVGTPETALSPSITLSAGATVNPLSSAEQNFFTTEQGIIYTVTAEDGVTTKIYTVKATIAVSTECDILSFTVNEVAWEINGTDITHTFPVGTPETALSPSITLSSGATVNPASGIAQNLFSPQGVTYTVTAEDGKTTKSYTVKATVAVSTECDILSFTVNEVAWEINGTDITHTFPVGTPETALSPSITLSAGATVNPLSSAEQNFFTTEQGIIYTVTAEDGVTTKIYTVKATVEASAACDIVSFNVDDVECDIDGTDITFTYYTNYSLVYLTSTIILSPGATVSPSASESQNFFTMQGVTYTVTAADGVTTKTYTVKGTKQAIISGATGNCTWSLTGESDNYTITISGNGDMANYGMFDILPWYLNTYNIKAIVIQDGVTNVGQWAFNEHTKVSSVTIGNSATKIGYYAFGFCTMTTVTIGNSVNNIEDNAFWGCYYLTEVINLSQTPQNINSDVFGNVDMETCTLKVPASALEAYKTAAVWKDFGAIVAIP